MTKSISWYLALTLDERIALLKDDAAVPEEDPDAAAQRLAEWRADSPFEDPELFARKLAQLQLDEAGLARILCADERAFAHHPAPPWSVRLAATLARPQTAAEAHTTMANPAGHRENKPDFLARP